MYLPRALTRSHRGFLESRDYIFTVTPRLVRSSSFVSRTDLSRLRLTQAGPCLLCSCPLLHTQRNNEIDSHEWRIHTAVGVARMRRFINSGLRAVVTIGQSASPDFRSSPCPDISFYNPRHTHGVIKLTLTARETRINSS